MLNDQTLALLGDHAAAKRITGRGELLPCPKCRGEADRHKKVEDWLGVGWYMAGYTVFCKKCKISVQYAKTQKEADLDWNTRAPILTPEQIKRVEEVK